MKETFKAGDKVYTVFDGKIHALSSEGNNSFYTLCDGHLIYGSNGQYFKEYPNIHLFHATKENKAKLEALFGVEYEAPALTDEEQVIEALKLGKPVLCEVWDDDGYFSRSPVFKLIISYHEGRTHPFTAMGLWFWGHAKLVSIKDYTYLENACIIK